jgi:hypothetical protein
MDFVARQVWLIVPVQAKIKEFFLRLRAVPLPGGQLSRSSPPRAKADA